MGVGHLLLMVCSPFSHTGKWYVFSWIDMCPGICLLCSYVIFSFAVIVIIS